MHLMTDDVVGVFVIASPWLFAFTAVLALRSTPNSATVSCSSVDATISKSGEFRFVGDEAFKVGDYCDGSTRRSSTEGSVLMFCL
jgi:hypothetical protein